MVLIREYCTANTERLLYYRLYIKTSSKTNMTNLYSTVKDQKEGNFFDFLTNYYQNSNSTINNTLVDSFSKLGFMGLVPQSIEEKLHYQQLIVSDFVKFIQNYSTINDPNLTLKELLTVKTLINSNFEQKFLERTSESQRLVQAVFNDYLAYTINNVAQLFYDTRTRQKST